MKERLSDGRWHQLVTLAVDLECGLHTVRRDLRFGILCLGWKADCKRMNEEYDEEGLYTRSGSHYWWKVL